MNPNNIENVASCQKLDELSGFWLGVNNLETKIKVKLRKICQDNQLRIKNMLYAKSEKCSVPV